VAEQSNAMNPMSSLFFETFTVIIERLFWIFGITSDSWNRLDPISLHEIISLDREVSMSGNPWEGLTKSQALKKIETLIRIYSVFLHRGVSDVEACADKIGTLREFHAAISSGMLQSQFPDK